jgi:hypothetical protein
MRERDKGEGGEQDCTSRSWGGKGEGASEGDIESCRRTDFEESLPAGVRSHGENHVGRSSAAPYCYIVLQ